MEDFACNRRSIAELDGKSLMLIDGGATSSGVVDLVALAVLSAAWSWKEEVTGATVEVN